MFVINTYRLSAVIVFQVARWMKRDPGADARKRTVSTLSIYFTMAVKLFGGREKKSSTQRTRRDAEDTEKFQSQI